MEDVFRPAINALQQDVAKLEAELAKKKSTINQLCEAAGIPVMYENVGGSSGQPTVSAIKPDTFYGKVVTTAAREYLEMRKAAGLGPATPREVYEALKKGGYAFDTKDETNAITSVRQTMRKNSSTFHRLPGGEYGLLVWYERVKQAKSEPKQAEEEVTNEDDDLSDLDDIFGDDGENNVRTASPRGDAV